MTMTMQILLGTLYLSLSTLFQVAVVASSVPVFHRLTKAFVGLNHLVRNIIIISFGLLMIVFVHTAQIWFWAGVYHAVGAFEDFETSFYFATVTYTTLGYGDLVLGEGLRIFATFSAITGLLAFGISTAVLIAILNTLLAVKDPSDR